MNQLSGSRVGDRGVRVSILVGVAALAIGSLFAIKVLADANWDATTLVGFGEDAVEIRQYAESRLGEVVVRPQLGHDGRFFFVQANDPWVLDPESNAAILDRPLYRTQRMFYPLMAGGFGLFGPEVIVWGMLVVNLVAMGLGTWAVALIATGMGGSPWWGLAFVLNLGLTSELYVGGAGIVASAAAFGAVALLLRGKTSWAVALMTLAVLSREVMLIAAAGASFFLWREGRRKESAAMGMVPLLAVLAWGLYVRTRIGFEAGTSEVLELGLPFVGFVQSFQAWLSEPIDLLVGCTIMVLLLFFLWRTVQHNVLVGWTFVGFVPLAILLTEPVWRQYFNATRAIAPAITAFVLVAFLGRRPTSCVVPGGWSRG